MNWYAARVFPPSQKKMLKMLSSHQRHSIPTLSSPYLLYSHEPSNQAYQQSETFSLSMNSMYWFMGPPKIDRPQVGNRRQLVVAQQLYFGIIPMKYDVGIFGGFHSSLLSKITIPQHEKETSGRYSQYQTTECNLHNMKCHGQCSYTACMHVTGMNSSLCDIQLPKPLPLLFPRKRCMNHFSCYFNGASMWSPQPRSVQAPENVFRKNTIFCTVSQLLNRTISFILV